MFTCMIHAVTMSCSNFGSRSPEAVLPDLRRHGKGCGGRETTEEKARSSGRFRYIKRQWLSFQLPYEQRRITISSRLSDYVSGQESMDNERS
eukprot:13172650-Heterocapsa_arctica.AAC.1